MTDEKFDELIEKIVEHDSRYAMQSYAFVNESVSFTIEKLNRTDRAPGKRHVSPRELVNGFLEFTAQEFGILGGRVMVFWGIRTGLDVGNIVFNMINAKILCASPEDTLEAFDCFSDIPEFLDTLHIEAMTSEVPRHVPPKIS